MHSFFLRVMVGTGIHTQPSARLHTPPVYIDYIIILSYRLRRVSVLCSAPSSCHYCGTNPGFDFLLVSLTWFKPGERLSLANGWMCQYP